LHCQRC